LNAEVIFAMRCFGAHLDIDAAERQRRSSKKSAHAEESRQEQAQAATNFGDIEKVLRKKHFPTSSRLRPSSLLQENATAANSALEGWDLPEGPSLPFQRYHFFEQSFAAARWAKLMDRPYRGNNCDVWCTESQSVGLPSEMGDLLCQSRQDVHGVMQEESLAARSASIFAEKLQASLQIAKKHVVAGSSGASTATGGTPIYGSETPSPEALSVQTTPRESLCCDLNTTRKPMSAEIADADFHIVNAPSGKHTLLQSGDFAPVSCQSLNFPLSLRRVMSAALPADAEASLKLSPGQVHRLNMLCGTVEKQPKASHGKSLRGMRRDDSRAERRLDPLLEGRSVTYDEMLWEHAAAGRQATMAYWKELPVDRKVGSSRLRSGR
jgi:hypothetical protein